MQGLTHALTGMLIGTGAYAFFGVDPLPALAFAALGAIFPDFDVAGSLIGRYLWPLPKLLQHRGITHTLIMGVFLTVTLEILLRAIGTGYTVLPLLFFFGYLSHLLLDSRTKMAFKPFYPAKLKVSGPYKMGCTIDWVLALVMTAVLVWFWV